MNEPYSAASTALLSTASATALEAESLLALLAELAATDLGHDRLLALAPATTPAELDERRARFDEAGRLGGRGGLVASFEAPLGALLERLAEAQPSLAGAELVQLADLGKTSLAAVRRVREADPPCLALAHACGELPDVSPLLELISRTLDRRGDVREDASPLLAELRRRIRSSRDQLYRNLSEYLGKNRDEFSEDTVPMRGGRLVLVLASGSRGRLSGLTHGRSGSGKSFYFEPLEVVEGNNTLQQAVEDEEAERHRILAELIAAAREHLPGLRQHAAWVAELDLLQAGHRFAELTAGRLADVAPHGWLRLEGARHPLLLPELADLRATALGNPGHRGDVVPLDLELSAEHRCLVVTGPNAGGKTVALKTVGLLAFAHLCGLPVPAAAGTAIPWLDGLVAAVGDEQDLLNERSTFSGRLLRLKEAWETAGPESLILLDELGSGTDPAEGAALAVSLLEGLVERGGLALITTHLTPLAAAALELPGAGCAAMEFASDTGRPTYHLLPGPPGGSEALALARRLGLPAELLDRAESRLGPEHRDLRRLLAEVERVRGELADALLRASREATQVENSRRRLAAELAELEDERRTLGKKLKADLDHFRRDAQKRLRDELERLRGEVAAEKPGARKKALDSEAIERVLEGAPVFEEPEPEVVPLALGGKVRHRTLGWEGVLEGLERDRAEVAVRGKRLRCRPEELVGIGGGGGAGAPKKRELSPRPKPESDLDGSDRVEKELHLIGQRVEPALELLDEYLDRALLSGREEVRVVHGHGSGRLRQAVREHLRRHRAVARQRSGEPNEGGDGATVVTLKA